MAKLFRINLPEGISSIKLDSQGRATLQYTVKNVSQRPIDGRAKLTSLPQVEPPSGPVEKGWVKIDGKTDRHFDVDKEETFIVKILVPPKSTPGIYTFRLDTGWVDKTDEGDQGAAVSFTIGAVTHSPKPFPTWLIPVLLIMVVGLGVGIWLATRSRGPKTTELTEKLPKKEQPIDQPAKAQPSETLPPPQPQSGRVWVIRQATITPDPEQRDPSDPEHKMRFKTGEENFDAVYDVSQSQFPELNIDGPVISTSCSFNQAYYHMTLCTPVNNQFHCHAHKGRSDTRSFWYINVKYLSPKERCVANCGSGPPTPLPDEDDPNNYSFNVSQSLNNEERGCTWQAQKVR